MNKILIAVLAVFASFTVRAADLTTVQNVSSNTPLTLVSGAQYLIKAVTWVNPVAAPLTIKFYDSSANSTSIVRAAYNSYASYATNFSTVFTNTSGILVTNTTAGIYTAVTENVAATNQRPLILGPWVIPASATYVVDDIKYAPMNGFTVYATLDGTVQVDYERTTQ